MKYIITSRFTVLIGLQMFFIGCGESESRPVSQDPVQKQIQELFNQSQTASQADLSTVIAREGAISFLSFDGNLIGMDGDSKITFMPEGKVEMIEYGYGISDYPGTYSVDGEGKVTLNLPTFDYKWPEMVLRMDATTLLLFPVNDEYGVVMGGRGGMTYSPSHGTYWPFRQVENKPEVVEIPATQNQGVVPDFSHVIDNISKPSFEDPSD